LKIVPAFVWGPFFQGVPIAKRSFDTFPIDETRYVKKNQVARLLRLLRPYPWLLPVLIILGIAASLAEAVGIGLLIPLLGLLLNPADPQTLSNIERTVRAMMVDSTGEIRYGLVAGAVFMLIVLKTIILIAYVYVASTMTGRITMDMRVSLWDRVAHAEMSWLSRSDQGKTLNILENQTYRATEALSALSTLIISCCTLLVFGAFLFVLSWPMALVVMIAGIPVFLLVRRLTFVANGFGYQLGQAYAGLAGRVIELLSSMKTIRVFNRQADESKRFAAAADALRKAFLRAQLLQRTISPVLEMIYLPVFFAVIGFAIITEIGIPVLLAFLLLLYRMQTPLKAVDAARVNLGEYVPALEDVDWLILNAPDERVRSGKQPCKGLKHSLTMDDVWFSYPGSEKPALCGVSTQIKKGEIVALVGPSGSGKSTFVHLVFGLSLPDSGRILIDGEPLEELDLYSWRDHIAFAGQDGDLLTGTARHNISYGMPNVDAGLVERVAREVHAHDFLTSMPQGYDTHLGTRGGLLSGGQRQRVALARALICKPDLLVLDEATSAIDTETELAIQSAISSFADRATIIIIAHRASTLMMADRVLVMNAGRIVEDAPPRQMSEQAASLAGVERNQ
jgi:ATP-binding cassette, subfamily B, bacterial MsbA